VVVVIIVVVVSGISSTQPEISKINKMLNIIIFINIIKSNANNNLCLFQVFVNIVEKLAMHCKYVLIVGKGYV